MLSNSILWWSYICTNCPLHIDYKYHRHAKSSKSNAMHSTINKIKAVLINLLEVDNTLKRHENARTKERKKINYVRQFFSELQRFHSSCHSIIIPETTKHSKLFAVLKLLIKSYNLLLMSFLLKMLHRELKRNLFQEL